MFSKGFIFSGSSKVGICVVKGQPFSKPKRRIFYSSKLKEFADDNFKFYENGRQSSRWVENAVGIGEINYPQSGPTL